MKKIFLSSFVILSFAAYAAQQKLISGQSDKISTSTPLPAPATQTGGQSNTPSPTVFISPTPRPTTSQPQATNTPTATPTKSGKYKDGNYTGVSADAFYGNIQIKVVISGGKITDVQFLDYPQDRGHSVEINSYAMPILKSEAISAQSANVDIVSGATATSQAFIQSLQSALDQAK